MYLSVICYVIKFILRHRLSRHCFSSLLSCCVINISVLSHVVVTQVTVPERSDTVQGSVFFGTHLVMCSVMFCGVLWCFVVFCGVLWCSVMFCDVL